MAAFGAIEHLKRRSDEARNTAIMLLVILEQIEKVGLATELRPSIMSESLPLVLKSMNQYALTAEVGSQRLRGRARRHRVPTATADPLVVTIRTLGLRGDDPNQRGNDERLSAAMQRADVPWGCTALGALFLDRREMRLDYPGMEVDGLGGLGGRRDLLGVLPCSLAQMCESTSTAFGVLDEAGLVEFLQSAQQCYLALPLVGQAVTWQWRLKQDPKVSVLKAVARGFLEAAEAEARERGGATSAAGSLLERAVCWYLKAAQPLRASILCEDLAGTEQRDGGRIRGGLASGRPPCGRDILLHLLESLQELDAVRSRLVRDAKEMDGDGAEGNGRGVDGGGYDHDGFGGRGAVNALKLARAALSTAREFESDLSQAGDFTTGTSTLCQLVFKHSSEAFLFEEAFEAICSNPVPEERKEDLVKLARRMCDNGCLGELCSLPLSTCPRGPDWDAMGVVEETLWLAAENTREADMVSVEGVPGEGLPGGAGSRAGKKTPVNYYDCLYALYVSRENFVQAALAQDQLKTRLERHDHGRTIAFVAAAQRARLAAMNALAVAPPGPLGGDVAALFPPLGERRLDDAGLPEDVKTAASLAREAAVPGPAVELAMAKAAVDDGDWTAGENGRTSRSSRPPRRIGNGTAGPARWNGLSSEDDTAAGDTEDRRRIVSVEVGSLTSEVVSALLEEGRYEDAADVALERWNDQPKNKYQEMEKVVTSLSRACAQAEALADKYARAPSPPLPVLVRGVGPMKPRVPTGGTTECRERAESLWLVLRQMLRLDSSDNNFGYHRVAAKALLDESSTYKLPEWLEDAFLGQTKTQDSPVDANAFPPPLGAPLVAPWKAAAPERGCGTRGANPTALLDLYVFAGRLEEGCLLLCRLLSVEKVLSEENGTDWLPYASIDRLFGLCEGSLTRRQKELSVEPDAKRALRSSLEEAYKAAKLRLTEYFKIAKHLAESARVYQASFSLSTSPSVFMMTD